MSRYAVSCSMIYVYASRLETEEQARQKLQLDKVAAESRIKKLEETLAVNEDTSAKVSCQFFCTLSRLLAIATHGL